MSLLSQGKTLATPWSSLARIIPNPRCGSHMLTNLIGLLREQVDIKGLQHGCLPERV